MVCFLQGGFKPLLRAAREAPLLWAASGGHVEVASLLLDRGANPEARDKVSMPREREARAGRRLG